MCYRFERITLAMRRATGVGNSQPRASASMATPDLGINFRFKRNLYTVEDAPKLLVEVLRKLAEPTVAIRKGQTLGASAQKEVENFQESGKHPAKFH